MEKHFRAYSGGLNDLHTPTGICFGPISFTEQAIMSLFCPKNAVYTPRSELRPTLQYSSTPTLRDYVIGQASYR